MELVSEKPPQSSALHRLLHLASREADGNLPNNWDSMFEGKIWQWDEVQGEYYIHTFAVKQPDLNMDNPLVREEVKKIRVSGWIWAWTASVRT